MKSSRAAAVAALVVGLLGAGATAALADPPDDPYCDVGLPLLYQLGYNGEDPRCH